MHKIKRLRSEFEKKYSFLSHFSNINGTAKNYFSSRSEINWRFLKMKKTMAENSRQKINFFTNFALLVSRGENNLSYRKNKLENVFCCVFLLRVAYK
jgi:hypothetical protein